MLLLKPVTIETIAMTVATPTTMPRTVRPARSLWARTASSAKRTFSPKPRRRWVMRPDISFVPQRLDRRQLPGLRRRDQARGEAGQRRHANADQDEGELDLSREDLSHHEGDQRAERHPDHAPDRGEQRCFQQKLPSDVAATGSQSPPDSDLLGPLDNRDEHDVRDHDRADDQRDARDQDHEQEGPGRDVAPEILEQLGRHEAERVVLLEFRLPERSENDPNLVGGGADGLDAPLGLDEDTDVVGGR